jgi:SAM-dependent methyltransferase
MTTRAVVARPALWRVFRGPLRKQFDLLAREWERMSSDAPVPLAAALDRLDAAPRLALDVGTGTGKAAQLVAERFPAADVVGVDFAPGMVEEAGRLLPPELAPRVRFEIADASALPFPAASFDLVVLLNMIPFFAELGRVTAAGGTLVVVHGGGSSTPIWTPAETLREKLAPEGFGEFEELAEGGGTAFLARKAKPE